MSQQFVGFYDSLKSIQIPIAQDQSSGLNIGAGIAPSTINPGTQTRCSSEDAYSAFRILTQSRPDPHAFSSSHSHTQHPAPEPRHHHSSAGALCQLVCDVRTLGRVEADVRLSERRRHGCHFLLDWEPGESLVCRTYCSRLLYSRYSTISHGQNASSEVLISAGTVQTPQLLELSGVGDPSILGPRA